VGRGEEYEDYALQDEVEGKALYDLLEREVIPQFYNRGMDGLPREWIRKMKESMREVGKRFSSHRMLLEYAQMFYLPALANARSFSTGKGRLGKEEAAYLLRLRENWDALRIDELSSPSASILTIWEKITVKTRIYLAGLTAEEVGVELYYGALTSQGEIERPRRMDMAPCGTEGQTTLYCAEVSCDRTGRQGYTIRILPKHAALVHPFLPGLVKWG
jgi:glycogen phosphorylase